ncbi:DUF3078 domain-containing protein [Riemerella anatipestifer]|uniref:DUF3078 domain-containing protein n=1 Tax=Riemerella anatipestifer (strain ATCC 11845 / DSM 15868 / JCM 9532 / NCTC 11014) TaxID=693978 RepID=E4TAS4_RIEAD|nr:DUF3078 domain-containing protein [Riemerella anatipestifer]ADQ82434.1 hypothetical protein Riean_1276 [Riemerella anatipestifer ATCC 11845 = DSM 15868]ADZ12072.1 hypothetical protein RIA_0944 [Riemerella anatipestifer RA-GD]AFD56439.1 hypothetical protein RA0C_1547 [Riemerella anatipestifer ATCC 11845 = DSM 15868]AIH02236.1 hypothetical protein M949_1067 [Riemerella anatipestifer CH3]AKQ39838.1 hypothetical protein AS87_05810 [Riemerella anatipestifer Yb2]
MLKYLALFILSICHTFLLGQINYNKKLIDSISGTHWESQIIDIDSFSKERLVALKSYKIDTLISPSPPKNIKEDIPVTPYKFLRMDTPQKWYFWGQNTLVFNQSSFSNWNSGGNNSIGVIGNIDYNLSYKNRNHYWENIVRMGYGMVSTQNQVARKTDDYLNIMSNYGYEIGRNYYLSMGIQFLTQFMPGYNYAITPKPIYENRISKFMAPGYINAGMGISYNPNENFQVVFRPANTKLTFVLDEKLQRAGRYGLERDGQSVRTELGAMLTALYRLKIYKDINLVNQIGFFTNYLNHPERVDINYTGTLNLKFSEFITSVVMVNLLYDHDQVQKLQMKQTLGIGLTYNFGADEKKKAPQKKILKPYEFR